jgi:hypothetical protein
MEALGTHVATRKSILLAPVLRTPAVPPLHLKLAGHVIVREPTPSCTQIRLTVCPLEGLVRLRVLTLVFKPRRKILPSEVSTVVVEPMVGATTGV